MECLLANYASSDEEHDEKQEKPPSKTIELNPEGTGGRDSLSKSDSKHAGVFSSLPPPKSTLFNSLPRPKTQSFSIPKQKANFEQQDEQTDDQFAETSKGKVSSSSMFSSLPRPKSASSSSSSTLKKVVQFRPPTLIKPHSVGDNEEDEDEDEDEKEKQKKRSKESVSTSSAISFLSSIPAPRHTATLGALPSAFGAGRRLMVETDGSTSMNQTNGSESNVGSFKDQSSEVNDGYSNGCLGSELYGNYNAYEAGQGVNAGSTAVNSSGGNDAGVNTVVGSSEVKFGENYFDYSSRNAGNINYYADNNSGQWVNDGSEPASSGQWVNDGSEPAELSYGDGKYGEHPNYVGSFGDHIDYAHYEDNWAPVSTETVVPDASGVVDDRLHVSGKRGRKDAPQEIVEVKQDDLVKNRPREHQTKMTGIAFGPAYQPASSKGKPSKLHKRKHQIGSLYFDMKQKETELAERRSKGYATKSQTQAKYGW